MSTEPPNRPRFSMRQGHFDINIGCFPVLFVLFSIVYFAVVLWAVTHPPVDYVFLILLLAIIVVALLFSAPRLTPFQERHPRLVTLLRWLPIVLLWLHNSITNSSIDVVRFLQIVVSFLVPGLYVVLLNTPHFRSVFARQSGMFIPATLLMFCLISIINVVYPHPDTFALFWASVGIVVSLIWLGVMWRRIQQELRAETR